MGEEKKVIDSIFIDRPLPSPPSIPLPNLSQLLNLTFLDSDLNLDKISWEHLHLLLLQTLTSSKVSNETFWIEPILALLHTISDHLTPALITSLSESTLAEWKVSEDRIGRKSGLAVPTNSKARDRSKDRVVSEKFKKEVEVSEEEKIKVQELKEELLLAARHLLPSSKTDPSALSLEKESDSSPPTLEASILSSDVPQSIPSPSIAEAARIILPKLVKYYLKLNVSETTVGALKIGFSTLGAEFLVDKFDSGENLFGKDDTNSASKDVLSEHIQLVGGTIHLTTFHKDAHKLSRVLELLVFALLSLKLENHLLRDIASSRPILEVEEELITEIPASNSLFEKETSVEADEEEEAESAESPETEEVIPSEEWFPSLGHKSHWSKSNFWNLIVGSTSSSTSASPTSSPSSPVASLFSGRIRGASISTIKSTTSVTFTSTSHKQDHSTTSATNNNTNTKNVKARLKSLTTNIKSVATRKTSSKNRKIDSTSSSGTVSNRNGHRRGPSMNIGFTTPGAVDEEIENGWDFIGGLGKRRAGKKEKAKQKEKEKVLPIEENQKVTVDLEKPVEVEEEPTDRFQKVIKAMEKCILSTSPSVSFPPPHLLVRLRLQELEIHNTISSTLPPPLPLKSPVVDSLDALRPSADRLRSYTTIDAQALAIGFASGKESMNSVTGVELGIDAATDPSASVSSTSSRATRIGLDARAGLASLLTNNNSLGGTIRHQGIQFLVETIPSHATPETIPCRAPESQSFSYYQNQDVSSDSSSNTARDLTIGQVIERLVEDRDLPCETAGCSKLQYDHTTYYMHSKERIGISLLFLPDDHTITSETQSEIPHDSVRPRISTWTTCKICHAMTEPHLLSTASLSFSFAKYAELLLYDPDVIPYPDLCEHAIRDRCVLLRRFAIGKTVVNLQMDRIELFELRLPTSVDPDIDHEDESSKEVDLAPVDTLRHEIHSFYGSIRQRLDKIADVLEANLPSSTATSEESTTGGHFKSSSEKTIVEGDEQDVGTVKGEEKEPIVLLMKLQNYFDKDESDLISRTTDLTSLQLNNARWIFLTNAKNARARIAAWELKHLSSLPPIPSPLYIQPDYFSKEVHIFPVDSSVIVREKELSSIIALTLSAKAFQDEVASPTSHTSRKVSSSLFESPLSDTSRKSSRAPIPAELFRQTSLVSSGTSTPSTAKDRVTSLQHAIIRDPDDSLAEFITPEEVVFVAKQKKAAGRTGSSILNGSAILSASIRGLSSQKSSDSFGFFRSPLPTPTEDLNEILPRTILSESVLEDLIASSSAPPPTPPSPGQNHRALPSVISTLTKRQVSEAKTTSSHLSVASATAERPFRASMGSISSLSSLDSSHSAGEFTTSASGMKTEVSEDEDEEDDDEMLPPPPPISDERIGSRILSGSINALLSLPGSLRLRSPSPSIGLNRPSTETAKHIKFNFRHGDKAFRVTAYHADKFQLLRARCGLDENLFIESLSRCNDFASSGGKSKAAFLMTLDSRFILRELVNGWGTSERESFLSFAPALLDYLMAPEIPSLLAKIYGFYTVKSKDLKTGETTKLDLVVMEHLFHSQTITRQFDLKGVASRAAKIKVGNESKSETGWDRDFLIGSQQTRILIYSHSKTLLIDSLLNDTNFLSQAGNIDYSLLVGVNDDSKELVVGLIDVLGQFNTLKMIESVGKKTIAKASSGDSSTVTVLPPADYASRFRNAMNQYFVAVPEKFSRPPGISDPDPRLPSVL